MMNLLLSTLSGGENFMKILRNVALGALAVAMATAVFVLMPAKNTEAAGGIAINKTNFPDKEFRSYIA